MLWRKRGKDGETGVCVLYRVIRLGFTERLARAVLDGIRE